MTPTDGAHTHDGHEHDLVRVEDTENGLAWQTCKDCPYRTEAEPWAPMTQEDLDAFNARSRAAMDGSI